MTEFRHVVTTEEDGLEVRQLMRTHFDFSSRLRGRIKREHLVYLNEISVPGFTRAKSGDVLRILLPQDVSGFPEEDIPITCLYEDEHLMLVNKQPGVTVHPTKGHTRGTIANGLMKYMREHAGQDGNPFKIRFVNRLDMDTSGLLMVAKNAYVQNDLVQQMKGEHLGKEYLALAVGLVSSSSGTIDLPIGHPDPESPCRGVMVGGAPSITHYTVLERYAAGYSLLRLRLGTGRTHQIRVHLSHIGHPIVSDPLYGSPCPALMDRHALHAASLTFVHPVSKKELHIEAPIPSDMEAAITRLRAGVPADLSSDAECHTSDAE